MDEPLRRSDLALSIAVAYLGEDEDVLDWGQLPVVGVLWRGHPGRVHELHDGMHVLVAWFGLEDADVSQVVGYAPDHAGELYLGLAGISEAEYSHRVERLQSQTSG